MCKTLLYNKNKTAMGNWKLIHKFHKIQGKMFREIINIDRDLQFVVC